MNKTLGTTAFLLLLFNSNCNALKLDVLNTLNKPVFIGFSSMRGHGVKPSKPVHIPAHKGQKIDAGFGINLAQVTVNNQEINLDPKIEGKGASWRIELGQAIPKGTFNINYKLYRLRGARKKLVKTGNLEL